jgi:hypothetical protein
MDLTSPWSLLLISLAGLAVGLFLPGGWSRFARPLAVRPVLAAVVLAALNVATNLVPVALHGLPGMHVQDEYGYALIADTFLHGRLTNPTPADADAFASPHVLLGPTYTAKYPPAQGVALAAGTLMGRPVYGVWLTCAAAAVAVYWALLVLVPADWALLGGAIAATHPQLADWGYGYWGGAVAVLGGALALGGWARLFGDGWPGHRRALPATALGVGLVVLAFSRPYEGFVLSLPLLASLALRWRRWWATAAVPLLSILLAGGTAMALYNFRVTGNPLRLPFTVYAGRYDVAPKFWMLPARPTEPAYPNYTLRWVHAGYEMGEYVQWRTLPGILVNTARRAAHVAQTFGRPLLLLLPLAMAVGGARGDPRLRWLWVTLAVSAVGLWIETFFLAHYAAPAAAVALALTVVGWRRLHGWSPRLARGLAVGYAAAAAVAVWSIGSGLGDVGQQGVSDLVPALRVGRHLIFVRYTAEHPPHVELVYDGADPAGQRLLWARWRGPAADRAVVHDYPGRRVWLLTVGRNDLDPQPYAP